MPLVLFTGIPSCGKTKRANELVEKLSKRTSKKIILLNEENLSLSKDAYLSSTDEKNHRGSLISAVERHLSNETVVILDSINYIKGFRYQLYCIARAMGTSYCLVHVLAPVDLVREWNTAYSNFEALLSRYEEPAEQKWDKPYFPVMYDEQLDVDGIYAALFERKIAPPNQSTVVKPATSNDYLSSLDSITNQVLEQIIQAQKFGKSEFQNFRFSRNYNLAELRRWRHQFINLNKQITQNINSIESTFVDYLASNLM